MRLIPQLDTYPRVVQYAQTGAGKLLMLGVFALGLRIRGVYAWPPVILILGLIMLLPKYRNVLAALGALYYVLFQETWVNWRMIQRIASAEDMSASMTASWTGLPMRYFWLAAAFLFYAGLWFLARRPGKSLIARRPILVLFTIYSAVLVTAACAPLPAPGRVLLWTLLAVACPYLRCCAYTLQDRHAADESFPMQLRAWMPFWSAAIHTAMTPIPKGAATLRKIESTTPKELAITHLKGVKLLYWALFLQLFAAIFDTVVHGHSHASLARLDAILPRFSIPTLVQALNSQAAGNPLPWYLGWGGVISHLFEMLLLMAAGGNGAIACCRMAGFRALRFSHRPLEAGSIAELWNRYHYYFKEMMVEFFFYPTYLRYFKKHPRLRIAAATFAAACLGNALVHFLRDLEYIADLGFWRALYGFQVYLFYGAMLASGITISQLRKKKRAAIESTRYRRMIATVPALLFFALLEIFDQERRDLPLSTYFSFFGHLFSIHG